MSACGAAATALAGAAGSAAFAAASTAAAALAAFFLPFFFLVGSGVGSVASPTLVLLSGAAAGGSTANAVTRHLAGIVKGDVRIFALPQLGALQIVCERSLGGGVTTSLALDAHGKSLSFALLEMQITP